MKGKQVGQKGRNAVWNGSGYEGSGLKTSSVPPEVTAASEPATGYVTGVGAWGEEGPAHVQHSLWPLRRPLMGTSQAYPPVVAVAVSEVEHCEAVPMSSTGLRLGRESRSMFGPEVLFGSDLGLDVCRDRRSMNVARNEYSWNWHERSE